MNTQLKKLLDSSNLNNRDKYEIAQIFSLLPGDKQQNILDNFPLLILRLEQIHKEIELERKILVGDLYEDIKSFYNKFGDKL